MLPIKMVILLIILVGLLPIDIVVVPYISTTNTFHMNYTGECTEGVPAIGFTNIADSLDIDSLLTIYPTIIMMEPEAFIQFIESRMEIE